MIVVMTMLRAFGSAIVDAKSVVRRCILAIGGVALLASASTSAPAQQRPAQKPVAGSLQTFPTPQAAFEAFVAAVKSDDEAAKRRLLGADFRKLVPVDADRAAELRREFLDAHAAVSKVDVKDDREAVLEVGSSGWILPIPVVKGADGWRFDAAAGLKKIKERLIGRNELATIQTLLAAVDAQFEYADTDPMKTGSTQYARRFLSSPGKKDGLYWESKPGDADSPLGEAIAKAQADGANRDVGYNGYRYRLLYAQGSNAPGGAFDYIVKDRMVGGFGFLAWPVRYGETGVMTFMVNHDGVVYEKDLGPNTAAAAAAIRAFDPDKSWDRPDTTP